MTIDVVQVANVTSPIELQSWFDNHPSISLVDCRILNVSGIFYIIY
jgi:hypothetical protein